MKSVAKQIVATWLGLFVLAFVNGAIREGLLKRIFGIQEPLAHQMSCFIGIALWTTFVALIWNRISIVSVRRAALFGGCWLALTIVAETLLLNRLIGGMSWEQVRQTYNVSTGNLWVLVVFWIAVLPSVMFHFKSRRLIWSSPVIKKPGSTIDLIGNPFRGIPFSDAICVKIGAERVRNQILVNLKSSLSNYIGDVGVLGLQISDVASTAGQIRVGFTAATDAMIQSGAAKQMVDSTTGRLLTIAFDSKTGKIIEQAKELGPSVASSLAKAGTAVVAAAHIVSSWDNAKTLKSIDSKIGELIAHRKDDRLARLESIYERISEILDSNTAVSESTLSSLLLDLKELRSSWIRDVCRNLKKIQKPSPGFFKKLFSGEASIGTEIIQILSQEQESLHLIKFSTQLETTVFAKAGQIDTFRTVTAPTIKDQVRQINELATERVQWTKALGVSDVSGVEQLFLLTKQDDFSDH